MQIKAKRANASAFLIGKNETADLS